MGLLLRHYLRTDRLAAAVVTTAADPHDQPEAEPQAATAAAPVRPSRGTVGRVARVLLWTILGLLVAREATEGLQGLRLRARRAVGGWWSDVERRSRRDTRRAQIGWLAGWIGPHRR